MTRSRHRSRRRPGARRPKGHLTSRRSKSHAAPCWLVNGSVGEGHATQLRGMCPREGERQYGGAYSSNVPRGEQPCLADHDEWRFAAKSPVAILWLSPALYVTGSPQQVGIPEHFVDVATTCELACEPAIGCTCGRRVLEDTDLLGDKCSFGISLPCPHSTCRRGPSIYPMKPPISPVARTRPPDIGNLAPRAQRQSSMIQVVDVGTGYNLSRS